MSNPKPGTPTPSPPPPSPRPPSGPAQPSRMVDELDLLKPTEVAVLARVSRALVYQWINTGQLAWVNLAEPGKRPRIRVRPSAYQAFVARRERAAA